MSNDEKLIRMLKYVSEHNDFYKKRIKEYGITNPLDITSWPILTRKELQENRYNMFSEGYQNKYYWNQLIHKTSSGSSGIPVHVYWDQRDLYSAAKTLWKLRRKYYGIMPYSKRLSFDHFDSDTKFTHYHPNHYVLSANSALLCSAFNDKTILSIISHFSPKWLYLRPSQLEKLVGIFLRNDYQPPQFLSYIETYGEPLSTKLQSFSSHLFNVPVANMYGTEEVNAIALSCPCQTMHLLNDNVYLECLNSSNFSSNEGEAIITSLLNHAMPLIRYNICDILQIKSINNPCACGSLHTTSLSSVVGRTNECVLISPGKELNPSVLLEIIGSVNNEFGYSISEYKFLYHPSKRLLECAFETNIENVAWRQNIIESLSGKLKKYLSGLDKINLSFLLIPPISTEGKKKNVFELIS